MARHGEALFVIDGRGDAPRLLGGDTSAHVEGGPDPATWRYRLHLEGPTESRSRTVGSEQVLHLRWSTDPARPWRGVSALGRAGRTSALLAEVERALTLESRSVNMRILALGAGGYDSSEQIGAKRTTRPTRGGS